MVFLKNLLIEWFFVEPSMASLEEPFEAPLFLRVHTTQYCDQALSRPEKDRQICTYNLVCTTWALYI